jgi:hypothetical protein
MLSAIQQLFSVSLKQLPDPKTSFHQARREADALFRPKPKVVETPVPTPTEEPARKPRVLRALPTSTRSEASVAPQPDLSVVQFHRERLRRVRATILRQQQELQARLERIEVELRAIAAYDMARRRAR